MPIARCPKCGGKYPVICWGGKKDHNGYHVCQECGHVSETPGGLECTDLQWMSYEETLQRDPGTLDHYSQEAGP